MGHDRDLRFFRLNPHGRTRVGSVGLPFPGVELQIRRFAAGDPQEHSAASTRWGRSWSAATS